MKKKKMELLNNYATRLKAATLSRSSVITKCRLGSDCKHFKPPTCFTIRPMNKIFSFKCLHFEFKISGDVGLWNKAKKDQIEFVATPATPPYTSYHLWR